MKRESLRIFRDTLASARSELGKLLASESPDIDRLRRVRGVVWALECLLGVKQQTDLSAADALIWPRRRRARQRRSLAR